MEEYFYNNLKGIRTVLDFVMKNPLSDFYRNKYKNLKFNASKIETYEEFCQLPFLTKEELLKTSIEKYIYIPKEKITHFGFSSGTTNINKPLIIPHTFLEKEHNKTNTFNDTELQKLGIDKYLVLFAPMGALTTILTQVVPKKHTKAILGDIKNLKLTAIITKELGIQGIASTPTILMAFIDELKAKGFDFKKVKWLLLSGELCTQQKFDIFKSLFQNARIDFVYGSAEIPSGLISRGYRCQKLRDLPPSVYHLNSLYFLEIIGQKENLLDEGRSGEIVHTDLFTGRAFPLIRYRTADIGSLGTKKCQCGNNIILKLGGRENYDVLKVQGTTLYSQLVENSLDNVRRYLKDGFQLHIYEDKVREKIAPRLVLKVAPIEEYKNDITKELIIKEVTENFIINNKPLSYFIEKEIFLPLEIEFTNNNLFESTKAKHIISHL